MEPKIFKSERDTQIVIEKKFRIKKGDEITVTYLKNDQDEIVAAKIEINDEFIGRFELDELEDFLTVFFSEPV